MRIPRRFKGTAKRLPTESRTTQAIVGDLHKVMAETEHFGEMDFSTQKNCLFHLAELLAELASALRQGRHAAGKAVEILLRRCMEIIAVADAGDQDAFDSMQIQECFNRITFILDQIDGQPHPSPKRQRFWT